MSLRETEQGILWNMIGSYTSLLKAADLNGIHRALGASYFAAGGFDEVTRSNYFGEMGYIVHTIVMGLGKVRGAGKHFKFQLLV